MQQTKNAFVIIAVVEVCPSGIIFPASALNGLFETKLKSSSAGHHAESHFTY